MRKAAEQGGKILKRKETDRRWIIPLLFIIPVAVVSIVMIAGALHSDGSSYALPFIAYGGVFRYNNIHLFGVSLHTLLMFAGLAVAILASLGKKKQYGYRPAGAVLLTVLFFAQAYLGAKLLYGTENVLSAGDPGAWSMSGVSLFGTLYLSMAAVPLLALLFRKRVGDTFDFIVPTWLILLAFVRTGCFLSGCCGAKELLIHGSPVLLPVQLFEVICDLILLALCLRADRLDSPGGRRHGVFPAMLVGYSIVRFLLELLRRNEITSLGITMAQFHCLLFLLVGIVWLVCLKKKSSAAPSR